MLAVSEGQIDLSIPAQFGITITRDVNLARFTTLKVGGPAEYFATVHELPLLVQLVHWAHDVGLPYFILGGGSNILISDAGMRGLVIFNRCRTVHVTAPEPAAPWRLLHAGSGAAMAGVARSSMQAGLTGLEWAVSVPGTIGGAVVGNAGAHGGEIKDNLEHVLLLDAAGQAQEVPCAEMEYDYRESALKRLFAYSDVVHPATDEDEWVLGPMLIPEEPFELGRVELLGDKLVLETRSAWQGARGREILQDLARGLIDYTYGCTLDSQAGAHQRC